jgi:membrane associated rhomboid family serine protease
MVGEFLTVILVLLNLMWLLVRNAVIYPLPLSDAKGTRYRSMPYVTGGLILVNALVFIFWQANNLYQGNMIASEAETLKDFRTGIDMIMDYVNQTRTYGLRTVYLREGVSIGAFTTFTSMFMHADMWHLFFNMFYLWAFGRRVEDSCGPWRFLVFYLVVGMAANIGSAYLDPARNVLETDLPGIGASGAIAGVMGAFLILHPGAWISSVWVVWSVLRIPVVSVMKLMGRMEDEAWWTLTPWVPAWILLGIFFGRNLLPALETVQYGQEAGVNFLAHLIGFLAGMTVFLFVRKDLVTRFLSGRAV